MTLAQITQYGSGPAMAVSVIMGECVVVILAFAKIS